MEFHYQKVSLGLGPFERPLDANWQELQCTRQRWQDAAVHRGDHGSRAAYRKTVARLRGPVWKSRVSLHPSADAATGDNVASMAGMPRHRADAVKSTSRRWRGGRHARHDVHAGAGPWARARAGHELDVGRHPAREGVPRRPR